MIAERSEQKTRVSGNGAVEREVMKRRAVVKQQFTGEVGMFIIFH